MFYKRIWSFNEYAAYNWGNSAYIEKHQKQLEKILSPENQITSFNGFSLQTFEKVDFRINNNLLNNEDFEPNLREGFVCPSTNLNNRTRAALFIKDVELNINQKSYVYLTEQTTNLYQILKKDYENLFGSEYIGDKIPFGTVDQNGIRNEDLENLQFSNEMFSAVMSFDVLEHVADYKKSLSEIHRVLINKGMFLWTAPFDLNSEKNLVRATFENGKIKHLLPPEYHGDPMSPNGCLCFRNFGWSVLEDMKEVGFSEAYVIILSCLELGFPGFYNYIIGKK